MLKDHHVLATSYRSKIESEIAEDRIEEAAKLLQDMVSELAPSLKKQVVILKRRIIKYKTDIRSGVAQPSEANILSSDIFDLASAAELSVPKTSELADHKIPGHMNDTSLALGSPPLLGMYVSEELYKEAPPEQLQRAYWKNYRSSRWQEDTTILSCEEINKTFEFGNFQLEPLTFSLQLGEIIGIVGRNASGKTTLLRLLQGEFLADSGRVRYPLLAKKDARWQQIRRQIGYVPQFSDPWVGRVKTNLHYVAAAYGTRGQANEDLVDWNLQPAFPRWPSLALTVTVIFSKIISAIRAITGASNGSCGG